MKTALIDGDIVAYRAASACQTSVDFGDGPNVYADANAAAHAAIQTVLAWTEIAGCERTVVAFTGRNNFRKRILPTYKANRAGKVKPLAYKHVVEAVSNRFETRLVDGLEADDLLGIMATNGRYPEGVVVTIDKDLRSVPGLHLNPLKDASPVVVTEHEANYSWLMQVLTGDTSDGYTGIPGTGPKKAAKILSDVRNRPAGWMWQPVKRAFETAKLTEADALTQARVARILRAQDYDKATKEILLWHPTLPIRIPVQENAA